MTKFIETCKPIGYDDNLHKLDLYFPYNILAIKDGRQYDFNTNRYVTNSKLIMAINEEVYNNMTSKETIKFFRGLGGTEKVTRKGGRVARLVSTSPSREFRTIRVFKFPE